MTKHITLAVQALRQWKVRQWGAALVAGTADALLLGFVTVLIPNDVFSRDVPRSRGTIPCGTGWAAGAARPCDPAG